MSFSIIHLNSMNNKVHCDITFLLDNQRNIKKYNIVTSMFN